LNNYAIILLTSGIFGGAEKRFTQLFEYLSNNYPEKYYFIVTWDLFYKILEVFPNYPNQHLIPIGLKSLTHKNKATDISKSKTYSIKHPGFIKQLYRFIKNYRIHKRYYREIDQIRKEKNISCFLGVYNGIISLYFYLMRKKRNIRVIFCDMDSWFRDVIPKEKKCWYKKFSSFNYALENSDHIDFLSPFILEGVKKRGIKIKEESVSITPCSFTDYSKCKIGNKSIFQVGFSGRLEKDKNPDLFLEAAIHLSKKYSEILFHIMGEGRLSYDIKEKVDDLGLVNIRFHGFHPQPTEILADTSIFVSIQTTNNYPSQSVLEAMGCGNAIIATDVGDTRMFINENNGILIKLEVSQLVNAIETLFLNKDLRERLGNYAYSYVRENHTIEKMAKYYVSLFDKASNKIVN
jgi:glycosyltransferase involved in cell wall biosynthesis